MSGPGGFSPLLLSTLRALLRAPPQRAPSSGEKRRGRSLVVVATASAAACNVLLNGIFEETLVVPLLRKEEHFKTLLDSCGPLGTALLPLRLNNIVVGLQNDVSFGSSLRARAVPFDYTMITSVLDNLFVALTPSSCPSPNRCRHLMSRPDGCGALCNGPFSAWLTHRSQDRLAIRGARRGLRRRPSRPVPGFRRNHKRLEARPRTRRPRVRDLAVGSLKSLSSIGTSRFQRPSRAFALADDSSNN
jgi:hypothetical protein